MSRQAIYITQEITSVSSFPRPALMLFHYIGSSKQHQRYVVCIIEACARKPTVNMSSAQNKQLRSYKWVDYTKHHRVESPTDD
jgi:hypothetical protein